eukprot:1381656-Pyramimonas_sp.AAC.1
MKELLRRTRDIQGNVVCVQVNCACYAGRVLIWCVNGRGRDALRRTWRNRVLAALRAEPK